MFFLSLQSHLHNILMFDGEGGREERREGPVRSVKPRALKIASTLKVASTLLMLRVQRMKGQG